MNTVQKIEHHSRCQNQDIFLGGVNFIYIKIVEGAKVFTVLIFSYS